MSAANSVSCFGDEFGIVEHLLRIQLKAPQCVISSMTRCSLATQENVFGNFAKNLENSNIVDVFFELSTLGQTVRDITLNGIKFPKNGLKITTSSIKLPANQEQYTLVHCQVALGKVHNYMNPVRSLEESKYEPADTVNQDKLPEGYQSLRLSDNDDFVVFNYRQVNAIHILTIKGGENIKQKELDGFVCDSCHKEMALFFCVNDEMKLCPKCDAKVHNASDVLKKHERKPLGEALPSYQQCPEHPDQKVQYYCEKCALPVCMECKVSGNHSKGPAVKHKLIPIAEAYKKYSELVQTPSQIRAAREKALTKAILDAEQNVLDIKDNLAKVIDEINRIAAAAIAEAKQEAGERIVETKSAISELQRKYNQFKAERSLLLEYYSNGQPVPFLQAYHRNEVLDKDIETSIDLQKTNARADLAVFGTLSIREVENKTDVKERSLNLSTEHYPKYTTLEKMATRKEAKYKEMGKSLDFQPFQGSKILTDEETAKRLYYCFPFKAMPETHLMFSTANDGRFIKEMHRLVDGKGISVIIVKANDRIFGGFAASKWTNDGRSFGEGTSSFLFSIDNNAFIQAHPQ